MKETRTEVCEKQSMFARVTDWDNWHGMFLLKFPNSITYNKKSYEVIKEKMPVSMRLGIVSFFLTYFLCILLGVSKAAKNGSTYDSVTSILVLVGYGIPGFVLAVFLIKALGPGSDSWAHLIPLKGIQSPPQIYDSLGFFGKLWDNIHHLIAPIICLTIGSFAGLTILTKNSVLEELHQLYAVAARARGLSKRAVLFPKENMSYDPAAEPATKGAARAGALVTYGEAMKRDVWGLWPPIPHSYKSSYMSTKLDRQRLANPFAHTVDGKVVPGAVEERHLLGTDQFGKDVLARLIYGFRLSMLFAIALAFTSTLLGCILGGIQGFFGGLTDLAGQRLMEVWGAIPQLMLLMILSDFLSRHGGMTGYQHIVMLFIIMNLTSWMGMAQDMRAQFLRERTRDYVRAAKALGVSDTMIMFRHILPNSLVPIVTFLPFSVSAGIGALVGLDYLGFGLKYPAPSLGERLAQGQQHLHAWWIMVPTFVTLTVITILLVFVGDAVRNAFDPRYK